ncbi:unnamed protein product [Penicillium bialowiezense]
MEGAVHRFRVHRNHSRPDAANSRDRGPTSVNGRRSTLPACRRCRFHKKRCTRTTEGPCEHCLAAWVPCSLMDRAASPKTRERELRSRIDWLSQLVNETLPEGESPIESVETGRRLALSSPMQQTPIEMTMQMDPGESVEDEPDISNIERTGVIATEASRKCLQAYFRHVHRTYPFLDHEFVLRDFEAICEQEAEDGHVLQHILPNRLCMVMAIGFTTLQRAGEARDIDEQYFQPCLKAVLCECVSRVDEESAGTLLLLGLYLLFKPGDQDPRAISGILTNHALAVGLMSDPSCGSRATPRELELRRRLGWSVYVFTRMISISYGLPVSFPDAMMKIPLPSIMIHEYGSAEGHQYAIALQVSRHVISLRQLETRIANAIHDVSSSPPSEKLRLDIEDWYTEGCLLSSSTLSEQDQVPFHTSITWLNVRYQNLLLLLFCPKKNGTTNEDTLPKLQAAAQQYIKLTLILHEHRHLPMNWITGVSVFNEIPEIPLLATLLELFPSSWHSAHEAARILRRLTDLLSNQKSPVIPRSVLSGSSVLANPGIDGETELESLQDELELLLTHTMGDASFFIWPLRVKADVKKSITQPFALLDTSIFGNPPRHPHNVMMAAVDDNLGGNSLQTEWMTSLGGVGTDML